LAHSVQFKRVRKLRDLNPPVDASYMFHTHFAPVDLDIVSVIWPCTVTPWST